jgi:hypothetical protein
MNIVLTMGDERWAKNEQMAMIDDALYGQLCIAHPSRIANCALHLASKGGV